MSVHCAQCGEELLGAVNRCWRCGAKVLFQAGDTDLPPIRRPPVPTVASPAPDRGDAEVVEAAFADAGPADAAPLSGAAPEPGSAGVPGRRRGSPFATSHLPPPAPRSGLRVLRWLTPDFGAVAACVLGLLSLIACLVSGLVAAIAAGVGLLLGVWGLSARRRGPAIAGILLCCLGLLIGSFWTIAGWYESRYGYPPWDAPGVVDEAGDGAV
jgi:DNA-directed RNA polymerase subunit RPC12/RpoP